MRIKKIIGDYDKNITLSDEIYNDFDRNLRLKFLELQSSVDFAVKERRPHYIADYVYNLCVLANNFYQNNHMASLEDGTNKNDWLLVLDLTNKLIEELLKLLVIEIPSVM